MSAHRCWTAWKEKIETNMKELEGRLAEADPDEKQWIEKEMAKLKRQRDRVDEDSSRRIGTIAPEESSPKSGNHHRSVDDHYGLVALKILIFVRPKSD